MKWFKYDLITIIYRYYIIYKINNFHFLMKKLGGKAGKNGIVRTSKKQIIEKPKVIS